MPVSRSLPYQWYDTPNVRCATIYDFKELAEECGLEVIEYVALADGKPVTFLPNLRGSLAVFRLRKKAKRALRARPLSCVPQAALFCDDAVDKTAYRLLP